MVSSPWLIVTLAPLVSTAVASGVTWTSIPFNPPSIPLAVRSPYLSTWLPQGDGTALNGDWPQFWDTGHTAWTGLVRVDGKAYDFLSPYFTCTCKGTLATQESSTFTSTQSTFVLGAGPIQLTVNFLSPIEPNDLVKQSIPFSYMAVTAASTDQQAHSVQVYTDITAEWIAYDTSKSVNWSTSTDTVFTHQVQLQTQQQNVESNNHQIQSGSVYYSTANTDGATFQTGGVDDVREQFISDGRLANTQDLNFRTVGDISRPSFALAHDLGTVGSVPSRTVVYSIGHVRDPAISMRRPGNVMQPRSLYFWTMYSSVHDVISDFLSDYSNALARANALDAQVQSDASKISSNYAGLVALSLRQTLGATELTISKTSSGAWNTSDVLMFMKDVSFTNSVNSVTVIYAAWPAFIYLNPVWGKYLLLPLFEYQASGEYPNKWPVQDMGTSYPLAGAHNNGGDTAMPIEQGGNMLIMTLSYTQQTGDHSIITSYTGLLDQWTQILIGESLVPGGQVSGDDFIAGSLANQTNLAIKGITGIKAMSVIYGLLNNFSSIAKSRNYSSIASSYVSQFMKLGGISSAAHLTLDYNERASWSTAYNLWADKHLKLNLFPSSIYDYQTTWYSIVEQTYGLPLDGRHSIARSDWQMFAAATVTDSDVAVSMVDLVVSYIVNSRNHSPLAAYYDATNGTARVYSTQPVVGGHLALLTV